MSKKFTEKEMELLESDTHPRWELTKHFVHRSGRKMRSIATCRITGKEVGEIVSTGTRETAREIRRMLKSRDENQGSGGSMVN